MSDNSRYVLDTGVLVSAALFRQSIPAQALASAGNHGVIIVSTETLEEVREVILRPKFDRYLSLEVRERFLRQLVRRAQLIEVKDAVIACRDPKDDKFLSLAVAGSANCIVTGDKDLIVLNPFRGVLILKPSDFVAMIDQSQPASDP
jgi:putative PIN family toxin of toxin-antitoxin system